ncbi:hypothetical protein R1sor_011122 [Riccia sorocarpa]|uniref:Uncharacterized protein n=1 Tax=Riccia sorocarpa TaxID=122646 RepID=A0ABD3I431_9MARC
MSLPGLLFFLRSEHEKRRCAAEMDTAKSEVQASKPNPTEVGFQIHIGNNGNNQQRDEGPSKGTVVNSRCSRSLNSNVPRRRISGNVVYDHVPIHRQPLAPASKLKSSDFRPRLCEEFPGDSCPFSPTPCGWPAPPPDGLAYGKPNRTPQEYGSGWPKGQSNKWCDRKEWLQQIHIPQKEHAAGIRGWNILPKCTQRSLQYGKNVGDILPRLTLRHTDVIILPCVDRNNITRAGYVSFAKHNKSTEVEPGTMVLRLAKSFHGGFRMRECIKLLLRTDVGWRFKGSIPTQNVYNNNCTPSNYTKFPVRYCQRRMPNTADNSCIPQRGDVIIHEAWKELTRTDRADKCSSLKWWLPSMEIDLNDLLVRMCVWINNPEGSQLDGYVELFMFSGIGLGWVFLGRDETFFDLRGLPSESDTSDDDHNY